jgi:hypothetical protein
MIILKNNNINNSDSNNDNYNSSHTLALKIIICMFQTDSIPTKKEIINVRRLASQHYWQKIIKSFNHNIDNNNILIT